MTRRRRLFLIIIAVITGLSAASVIVLLPSVYVVPVLMYHNIDQDWKISKLSVSPQSFERQMGFLARNGYNAVSLDKLVSMIKSRKEIPYKTIAVTFDDGYENNYTEAFPVLQRYNIPATVFVVVDKIGKEGYLTWKQVEEMADNNIEIGSHTLSECYLPDIKDKAKLKSEIYDSRRILKERIPEAGDFIAYCSGGFNRDIRQMAADAGYTGACATNPGKDYPDDDIYAIKRLRISRTSDNLFVFWIETSGFYTWIKEHRDED